MSTRPAQSAFTRFAKATSLAAGQPRAFIAAVAMLVLWGLCGPLFHWSDTWQLVANTATSLITFLMVFVIQNTQNRDTAALQVKVDELIRALGGAQNVLLDLEELDDQELEKIRQRYEKLAQQARARKRA
jgi:low affinity Fe/Cu permease